MKLSLPIMVALAALAAWIVFAAASPSEARPLAPQAEQVLCNAEQVARFVRQARDEGRPLSASNIREMVERMDWPDEGEGRYAISVRDGDGRWVLWARPTAEPAAAHPAIARLAGRPRWPIVNVVSFRDYQVGVIYTDPD